VYGGGVVVVTATDVASLYGKCPRTLLRNYGVRYGEVNLDCIKEVATRVLLAAVARLGGRDWFIYLYTTSLLIETVLDSHKDNDNDNTVYIDIK